MLIQLNRQVFLLVNAPLHPAFAIVAFAEVAAEWVIYAAMALVAALWIWGQPERRGRLLATVGGVSAAIGINQILGTLWYEPRPFVIGLGHTLIQHPADNSFPSDHATFMWSLGFSLMITAAAKHWGVVVWLTGVIVAWGRVYLGVHFPVDMVASLLVGVIGAVISLCLVAAIERWVQPVAELIYLRSLELMRLPPSVFPRGAGYLPDSSGGPV
jgi:undecaprenyl-diphosphatase